MPTYSFKCPKCQHEWDDFMWISEKENTKCPKCGEKAEDNYKNQNTGSILIQGKGFYQERTVR